MLYRKTTRVYNCLYKSLSENEKLSYTLSCIKQNVYTFLSFVCLVVTLLLLCIISLWDSAPAHSTSGKELNPSSQEDARFSGRCTSAYNFNFIQCHPSLGLSNSSLTLRYFYGERPPLSVKLKRWRTTWRITWRMLKKIT